MDIHMVAVAREDNICIMWYDLMHRYMGGNRTILKN